MRASREPCVGPCFAVFVDGPPRKCLSSTPWQLLCDVSAGQLLVRSGEDENILLHFPQPAYDRALALFRARSPPPPRRAERPAIFRAWRVWRRRAPPPPPPPPWGTPESALPTQPCVPGALSAPAQRAAGWHERQRRAAALLPEHAAAKVVAMVPPRTGEVQGATRGVAVHAG